MDLITINYKPREVAPSLRKKTSFSVDRVTIQGLNQEIDEHVKALQGQGFTLFILEFTGNDDEQGSSYVTCHVIGSRLETPEEVEKRVKHHEAYNARQVEEHKAKIEESNRRKEFKRLTGGLTLEQLQALKSLT